MANKKLTLSFEAIFVDRVSQGLAKLETDTLKVSKSVKSSLEAVQKGLLPIPTSNDQTAIVKLTEFKRLLDETKKSLDNLNSIKLLGAGKVPPEIRQQFTPGSNGAFNAAKADKERRDQIEGTKEFAKQLENLLNSEKRVQAFRESIAQSNRGILTSNYLSKQARLAEIENNKFLEKYFSDLDKEIANKFRAIRDKFLKEQKEFEKAVQGGNSATPTISPKTLLGLSPTDISKTQAGYTKLYTDLLAAQDKFVAESAVLARKQAANLALPLESLAKFNGRVNSTIVPQGSSLSSGLTNPVLPTPKINTEALANYQKQFARQEELAKNSAASLEGIALRRDIAIEQEEQRHAAKLLASEKALADAIAKNWSASAQKQITDQAALASSQSSQRINLLRQNADREAELVRANTLRFNQNLQEQTARTQAYIAEQHAIHVHGNNSLQAEQVRWNEKQRQLAQELQNRLTNISQRHSSGQIGTEWANAEVLHAQQRYAQSIQEGTRSLHAHEQRLQGIADRHRNIFLRVGQIISAYTVWNTLQNTIWSGMRSIPSIGIEVESAQAALTATTESAAGMVGVLEFLQKEADRTGISVAVLRETFKGFQASTSLAGETLADTAKMFQDVNSVVTALHLSGDKAQGIFNALAQIFNKTKVQSEELVKQLGNLIPGAFASFAAANKHLYANSAELIAAMKKGTVFAHQTVQNFTEFLANRFASSFEIASKGFNSNIGRMQTAWIDLGEAIYHVAREPMNAAVKGLTKLAVSLKEGVNGTNELRTTLEYVGEALLVISAIGVVKLADGILLAAASAKTLSPMITLMSQTATTAAVTSGRLAGAIALVTAGFSKLKTLLLGFLGNPVVATVLALSAAYVALRNKQEESNDALQDQIDKSKELIKNAEELNKKPLTLTFDINIEASKDPAVKVIDEEIATLKEKLATAKEERGKLNLDITMTAVDLLKEKRRLDKEELETVKTLTELDKTRAKALDTAMIAVQARYTSENLNLFNAGKSYVEIAKETRLALLSIYDPAEGARQKYLQDTEDSFKEAQIKIEAFSKAIIEAEKVLYLGSLKAFNSGDPGAELLSPEIIARAKQQIEEAKAGLQGALDFVSLRPVRAKAIYEQSANKNDQLQKDANAELKISQNKFNNLLKQQKEYLQTSLAFYSDYLDELEYKQNNVNTALTSEDFYANKLRALEEKRLEILNNTVAQTKALVEHNKELQGIETKSLLTAQQKGSYSKKEVMEAIAKVESGGEADRATAVSYSAALGKYQIRPKTAKQYGADVPDDILALQDKSLTFSQAKAKGITSARQVFSASELAKLKSYSKEHESELNQAALLMIGEKFDQFNGDITKIVTSYYGKADANYISKLKAALAKGGNSPTETRLTTSEANAETTDLTIQENKKQALLELDREIIKVQRENASFQLQRLQQVAGFGIKELELTNKTKEAALAQFDLENRSLVIEEQRRVNTARILDLDGKGTEETQQAYEIRVKEAKKILEILGLERRRLEIQSSLEALQRTQQANSDTSNLKRNLIDLAASRNQITSFRADLFKQTTAEQELQSSNFVEQIAEIRKRMRTESGSDLTKSQNEIDSLILRMKELEAESNKVGDTIKGQVVDNLTNSFIEFANGTKTATEALKSFGVNFLQMIEQIIVKEMALAAVEAGVKSIKMMFSSGGSVGDVGDGIVNGGAGISKQVGAAFATGGMVARVNPSNIVQLNNFRKVLPGKISGPGSDTSDSITTVLPDGSYILKASAARRIGYEKLQQLIAGVESGAKQPGKLVNVSTNEVNIPPEVVQKYGVGFFDNLNRADGGAVGHINNIVPLNSTQGSTSVASQVTNITVHVTSSGKEPPEELGTKISTSIMQAIAQKEAAKQVYLYDKSQKVAKGRKV